MLESTGPGLGNRPGTHRSLPFALFIGLMLLDPVLTPILPEAIDPRWLYAFRSLVAAVALALLCKRCQELREPGPTRVSDWGLGVVGGVLIFALWIYLDFKPLAFAADEGFDPTVGDRVHLGFMLTRIAGAALVVPIMEELFWRSFILRWLQKRTFLKVNPKSLRWSPILISSLVFASEHRLWFAGILAGLAYAWLYKRSGNLWVPIASHAITNALLGIYVVATASWWFW